MRLVYPHLLYRWRDQVLAGLPSLFSDKAALEFAQQALDYRTPAEVYFAI